MTAVPDPGGVVSAPGDILLAVDTAFTDGTAEVVLRGELDVAITPELLEQLADVLDKKPGRPACPAIPLTHPSRAHRPAGINRLRLDSETSLRIRRL
jgi:hypothetical protein